MKTSKSLAHCTTFLLVLSLLVSSGCSGSLGLFSSGPLEVSIRGQDDMNGGNAARVRIYQLAGETSFRNTPLSSFWRNDEQALGRELLSAPHEIQLFPNDETTVELEVAEKTQYIGIAADLRDPDRDQWRVIRPLDELRGETVTVTVGMDRVQLSVE